MNNRIVVFAGSKLPKNEYDIESIKRYAEVLALQGFDIIYGGGDQGLMGLVAKTAQLNGAKISVIGLNKYKDEAQLSNLEHISFVETESERFKEMLDLPGVVGSIVFPGGPGTIRECFSALEEAVYNKGKPVIIPDGLPVATSLYNVFKESLDEGLIKENYSESMVLWDGTTQLWSKLGYSINSKQLELMALTGINFDELKTNTIPEEPSGFDSPSPN